MSAYAAARLVALAAADDERCDEERAAHRLRAYLALDEAAAEARRCLLFHRDRKLHETLALRASPELLANVLDAVPVDGREALQHREGTLLVALHYGPYSTLLWLALARAVAAAGRRRLAVLVDRTLDPSLVLPDERARELDAHGVLRRESLVTIDAAGGRALAARRLVAELRAGGTALVLVDAYFATAGDPGIRCRLGRRAIALPRGAAWLAQRSCCRVAAAAVHPDGDGHLVSVAAAADVRSALARLLGHVEAEPAPWEGWLRPERVAVLAAMDGYHR